jgi:hypothetical protein
VHRKIQRAQSLSDDTFELSLLQVGESNVAALKKGQAVVLIFNVQAFSQTPGELIDKTEQAAVPADSRPNGRKTQTGVILIGLVYVMPSQPPPGISNRENNPLIVQQKLSVQNVINRLTVDPDQIVPGTYARAVSRTAPYHR